MTHQSDQRQRAVLKLDEKVTLFLPGLEQTDDMIAAAADLANRLGLAQIVVTAKKANVIDG